MLSCSQMRLASTHKGRLSPTERQFLETDGEAIVESISSYPKLPAANIGRKSCLRKENRSTLYAKASYTAESVPQESEWILAPLQQFPQAYCSVAQLDDAAALDLMQYTCIVLFGHIRL